MRHKNIKTAIRKKLKWASHIKRLIKLQYCLFALIISVLSGDFSFANDITPFYTRNRNPFIDIYGLPCSEGGSLIAHEKLETRLSLDISNNFKISSNGQEKIYIDGETYRANLSLRYGLRDDFEIGVDIPFISHNGGIFDGFIEGWHDLFGLPQASRDDFERNNLKYSYRENGVDEIYVDDSVTGFGDILFSMGYQLYGGNKPELRSLALRGGIKLPTGDNKELMGSGGTDFSLRITTNDPKTLSFINLSLFGTAGVLYINSSKVLGDLADNFVWFGTAGAGLKLTKHSAAKVQVDFHSPFYSDSSLKEINAWSAQLVIGGDITFSEHYSFDFGVSEDIVVGTAPDIVFHMALTRKF